jgi:pimeloyl-ACP methyl ester carboxylesterase
VHEDVADLAALIEHVGPGPAHVVGSSFGAVIVLRLAVARPDLFRTLIVHEPPLLALLDGPEAGTVLRSVRERMDAVLALLRAGRAEAGAQQFMESIAFGPGAWAQFPHELRQTFVFNAPTFLDEERDPDSRRMDVGGLAAFSRPALLSQGESSAPFFALILDRLAPALPTAQRRVLAGAGHVPQVTHPEEYVETITSFIRQAEEPGGS